MTCFIQIYHICRPSKKLSIEPGPFLGPKWPIFKVFDPKMLCLLCFCINNKYTMVKHVVSDNTVEFYSFPKKIMPVMAIFRPQIAQNGLFSRFFDPKMLCLLCFCINNNYSTVSDNTVEFY